MSAITAQHKAIRQFYDQRKQLEAQGVTHELAVREPFKSLLETLGKANGWTLVIEQKIEGLTHIVRPDGTLRDATTLPRGYWEAKDTRDDLNAEIEKKFARGYPKTNIIFEDTRRAVLYQSGERAGDYDLSQPEQIATLLERFFGYTEPNIAGFEQAMARFKQDTPELARGLLGLIGAAHQDNRAFQTAYAEFMDICKKALNLNISREAVDEMLIQHLLTERLMRTVFDNPDFAQRNAIAVEVEKVINALTSRSFSRRDFLGQLDYFYEAIEAAARVLTGFKDKQTFINTVYERFFQGYAIKVADTHGIVYTPQPIVDFMCAAVEEVLRDEFGLGLDHPDVCIIDPCTGTGNFILNLMRRLSERNPAALPDLYANRMFANEVMLLPYYISNLNIEHAYYEMTGRYEPFEGLCFVDTLDLARRADGQMTLPGEFTERNASRVERQQKARITVVIGNPPYNMGQVNENDNNKNRKYDVVDARLQATYVRDSKATLRNKLFDPYVRFIRWATDRLEGHDGIVCFVTNNSFVDQIAFDGMRKHLLQDFTRIFHLDLHGNVRQNPKLSGTTHNVFGIQVGVGITVAVRSSNHADRRVFYHRVPEYWRKEEKLGYLEEMVEVKGRHNSLNTVEWEELTPDARNTWLVPENVDEFEMFLPLAIKGNNKDGRAIFKLTSLGVVSSRDEWVYGFSLQMLQEKMQRFIKNYNYEVFRLSQEIKQPANIDNFINSSSDFLKWSDRLKDAVLKRQTLRLDETRFRHSIYRPFTKRILYFDHLLNQRRYQMHRMLPTVDSEAENRLICASSIGSTKDVHCLITHEIPDYHLTGDSVCFPFYVYDEDGSNRRENITDWALAQFRTAYGDETISKWDIFYYVYGLLHHPAYRERYADNLKRELPRIPLAGVEVGTDLSPIEAFRAFAEAGRKLADLHLGYEEIEPYPLEYVWKPGKPISWRVEKMRLSKDKTAIQVNDSLTLRGIPAAAFDYRLGNRSALDWIIDQYRVKTDKRSGITSDPNRYSEDEEYIVKLVGRVTRVSVETVAIVNGLPELRFGEGERGEA